MRIRNEYFKWMTDIVCGDRFSRECSYSKLLKHLHSIDFTWIIPKDSNRAEDGKDLRWRFAYFNHIDDYRDLNGPCSVLEMILALAIRCEESIMDDPAYGDRTSQWFWGMITNLGLGGMTDSRFDISYADNVIDRFLNREYDPDGQGGLFTIRDCEYDLRDVEIWAQMNWFLDSII